jgi:lipopolysaccharide export system ATP-binding protein
MYDGEVKFEGDPQSFSRDSGVRTHYLGEEYEL